MAYFNATSILISLTASLHLETHILCRSRLLEVGVFKDQSAICASRLLLNARNIGFLTFSTKAYNSMKASFNIVTGILLRLYNHTK
jgi:hypothetical protein